MWEYSVNSRLRLHITRTDDELQEQDNVFHFYISSGLEAILSGFVPFSFIKTIENTEKLKNK